MTQVSLKFYRLSGQHFGPIFMDQEFFTPEDGTDRLSRNVGKNYNYSLRNNPEERSS